MAVASAMSGTLAGMSGRLDFRRRHGPRDPGRAILGPWSCVGGGCGRRDVERARRVCRPSPGGHEEGPRAALDGGRARSRRGALARGARTTLPRPRGRAAAALAGPHRVRLAQARMLESDAPLAVIAGEVGDATEFAFAKAFKRLVGIAPGHFRGAGTGAGRRSGWRASAPRRERDTPVVSPDLDASSESLRTSRPVVVVVLVGLVSEPTGPVVVEGGPVSEPTGPVVVEGGL